MGARPEVSALLIVVYVLAFFLFCLLFNTSFIYIDSLHFFFFLSLFFLFGTVSIVLPLFDLPGLAVLMERMFQQPTGQDL